MNDLSNLTHGEVPARLGRLRKTVREKAKLGPSETVPGFTPRPAVASVSDTDVPLEAAQIARAVLEEGAISRGQLRDRVNAGLWGPAQFHRALRYALAHEMIRHVANGVYAPPRPDQRIADATDEQLQRPSPTA
jgi:hypothetical protein